LHGWLDGLAYPFYWLAGSSRSSEFAFRDARLAVALILLAAALGASLIRRAALFTRRYVQFISFFAVSYAIWLMLFSIQRYAVALEDPGAVIEACPLIARQPLQDYASGKDH
jgi:hypothetical protein